MFHLAHKLNDENSLMIYHEKLSSSVYDQLALASLHCILYIYIYIYIDLRSHYEDATEMYKKILLENREYIALNIYVALCYYKLDYYDVSHEILSSYLSQIPESIIGINLRACNHFQLYSGKSAEQELNILLHSRPSAPEKGKEGKLLQVFENDLIRHNQVVFRMGENALQVLPSLMEVIPEAKLNLVIYHLRNNNIQDAYELMKDVDPTNPKEFILKGVVHAILGQETENEEHIRLSTQLFQLVGGSTTECDSIPGRQCMASCFFLLRQFDDVLIYLKSIRYFLYILYYISIREFFKADDDFLWDYGIALAASGDYVQAEEMLSMVKSPKYAVMNIYL